MVPSGLHQLANSKEMLEIDFSSVTTAASGAAYLPPHLADRVKKIIPALTRITEGKLYQKFLHDWEIFTHCFGVGYGLSESVSTVMDYAFYLTYLNPIL